MRNLKVKSLDKIVPVKVRLQVYKDTLKFIESGKVGGGWDTPEFFDGLCMLLPLIMWDTKKYSEKDWDWADTKDAFPELSKSVLYDLHESQDRVALRKELLKKWIKELTDGVNEPT